MQSVIRRWGNSAGAILPARLMAKAGLRTGDAVDIEAQEGMIVIRQAQPEYSMDELLATWSVKDSKQTKADKSWLNDDPVGKELI